MKIVIGYPFGSKGEQVSRFLARRLNICARDAAQLDEETLRTLSPNGAALCATGSCTLLESQDTRYYTLDGTEFRFFIQSSPENRIPRETDACADDARQAVRQKDLSCAKNYRLRCGQDWNDLSQYDLVVNMDVLGIEGAAEVLRQFIAVKTMHGFCTSPFS